MARIEFEVFARGKNNRTVTYDDVGKFRAYVRKKAKEGFDATFVYISSANEDVIRCYVSLDNEYGNGQGMCRFMNDRTPGYQEVMHDTYHKGIKLNYHGHSHVRDAILDSGVVSSEDIQILLKAREVLARIKREDVDYVYCAKDAYRELDLYLGLINVRE